LSVTYGPNGFIKSFPEPHAEEDPVHSRRCEAHQNVRELVRSAEGLPGGALRNGPAGHRFEPGAGPRVCGRGEDLDGAGGQAADTADARDVARRAKVSILWSSFG
jgi:hypothetical protein